MVPHFILVFTDSVVHVTYPLNIDSETLLVLNIHTIYATVSETLLLMNTVSETLLMLITHL